MQSNSAFVAQSAFFQLQNRYTTSRSLKLSLNALIWNPLNFMNLLMKRWLH